MALLDQFLQQRGQLVNQAGQESQIAGQESEQARFRETSNLRSIGIGALEALNFADEASQNNFLTARAQEIQGRGGDATDTLEALEIPFEQRQNVLQGAVQIAQQAGALEGSGFGQATVRNAKILADGTVIQSLNDGSTQVISSQGVILEGSDRADAIRKANEEEIRISGGKSGAKETEKGTAKLRNRIKNETFTTLRAAPVQINNLKRIQKVFDKAGTGSGKAFLVQAGKVLPGSTTDTLENALSASGDFVLDSLTKLKGPITEKELAFMQTISPQIRNSPAGNRLIIGRAIQSLQDEQDLAKAVRDWIKEGNNPEDFDTERFVLEKESDRNRKFNLDRVNTVNDSDEGKKEVNNQSLKSTSTEDLLDAL